MTEQSENYRDRLLESELRGIEEKTVLLIEKAQAENKGFLQAVSDKLNATMTGISAVLDAKVEAVRTEVSTVKWVVALIVSVASLFLLLSKYFVR